MVAALATSVKTSSGTVNGKQTSFGNSYLGIPYAQQPIGPNRFLAAKALSTPNSSIDGTKLPAHCPQPNDGSLNISEECLFLNVYAPVNAKNLPVMVWFHGGSFIMGGSADPTFNGGPLAQEQNVIVVTVNYRLGAFGFLAGVGNDANAFLSDAIMSLKWVQNNIAAFGGAPTKVTVFGQSSGGTLVRALASSPSAASLFSGAIIQSDPQYSEAVSFANAQKVSKQVLAAAGCSSVDALRRKNTDEILQAEISVLQNAPASISQPTVFNPTIDGQLLKATFASLVTSKSLPFKGPMIMGTVRDELGPTLSALAAQITPTNYLSWLAGMLGNNSASRAVAKMAATLVGITDNVLVLVERVTTRFTFEVPTHKNAIALSQTQPVFLYRMDKGNRYVNNQGLVLCSADTEVCHEDDLYLVFKTGPRDVITGPAIRSAWAKFARTGNPGWAAVQGNTPLVNGFISTHKGGLADPLYYLFTLFHMYG